jgi:hypothetical protein
MTPPSKTDLEELARRAEPLWEKGRELGPGEAIGLFTVRDEFRAVFTPKLVLALLAERKRLREALSDVLDVSRSLHATRDDDAVRMAAAVKAAYLLLAEQEATDE